MKRCGRTLVAWLLFTPMVLIGCGGDDDDNTAAPTATALASATLTHTSTVAPTATATAPPASATPSVSRTATSTASVSPTATRTATLTATPSITRTALPTRTPTQTQTPVTTPVDDLLTDVLVFTHTAGFRHASIRNAVRLLNDLPAEEGLRIAVTEDPTHFNDDFLARFEVIAFVNTTGDVLDETQQQAMQRFIQSGKGFVGVHSAADTEYSWPWYGRLVGAYFVSHPILPVDVEVTTEESSHPTTAHLPAKFRFTDEIYNFDRNPRSDNVILLTVDEDGFIYPNTNGGPSMGDDHPIAWYKEFDGGRSFYTNLGHQPQTWEDPSFRQHLLEGIRWAAHPVTYSRSVVTRRAENPMALAVTPDGRVFYIERGGSVRVWNPQTGRVLDSLVLGVSLEGENGLLGIALDPDFAVNSYVYLYHSEPDAVPLPTTSPRGHNVLSRFTVGPDSRIDPSTRLDLLRVPSDRTNHEGGAVAVGNDGTLFLSVGDNTNPFDSSGYAPIDEQPGREIYNAQRTAGNPFDLRGKILRINRDGSIPAGNLFAPSGEQGRPEVFAMGVRNPFRTAVDPQSGRLFWGDVGPDAFFDGPRGPRGFDEINYADTPGRYGWPYCIGDNLAYADFDFATQTAGPRFSCDEFRPPLLAYDYRNVTYLALGNAFNSEGVLNPNLPLLPFTGRTAIAGAFHRSSAGTAPFSLPAPYADTLLMTDWTRDILASVQVATDGSLQAVRRFLPWERFYRPIDIEIAPDGALYVLEFGTGLAGDSNNAQVTRIEHSASGDLSPVAAAASLPVAGAAPLTVRLSADGSRALGIGGGIAMYEWDVDGDGVVDSTAPAFDHTFTTPGLYVVSLNVVATSGRRSLPAVVEVAVGNTPPEVDILEPTDGASYAPGSMVTLRGQVGDVEDGTIDCNKLRWDVRLGHNSHSHPQAVTNGCQASFFAGTTDHGDASQLYYVVELSYTDGGAAGLPPLTGRAQVRVNVVR